MARDVYRDLNVATLEPATARPRDEAPGATDLEALRELYARHAHFVRRAVLRLGGPELDADDLTHEVFLIALRKWRRLAPGTDAQAWLYGVAAREVGAARRKARWRRRLGLANRSRETGTDGGHGQREAREQVYRLVDRMSEKKRTVFLMFELEGWSGEEIAAALGCPLKTVWTRLYHARREFLAALEKEKRP